MTKVAIVLVDWMGYPLERTKKVHHTRVRCGVGRILANLQRFRPGVEFYCNLIVNRGQSGYRPRWFDGLQFGQPDHHNTEQTYRDLQARYPFVNRVLFRDNEGMDIGAYDHGLNDLRVEGHGGDVVFMNSSIQGPSRHGWLAEYSALFHRDPGTGLCGITMNSRNTNLQPPPFMPHVQSMFLYSKMAVLDNVFPSGLSGTAESTKLQVILEGEIGISQRVVAAGYSLCCSSFPDFSYSEGTEWTIPEGDVRYNWRHRSIVNRL